MRTCAILLLACAVAATSWAAKKKKKEEETQTLELPRELPNAVAADTRRLVFHVSPLSAKGLLSQQVRDALRALQGRTRGATIVKLRAFTSGSGDVRRVRDLVSETFTGRRQPLPVLSLVQAGALPLEGAQVVLEAAALAKKEVNPGGVAFIAGQVASSDQPLDPVPPLAEKALAKLRTAVAAAGSRPPDVLRVTCFLSSLERLDAVRKMVAAEYPLVPANYVQIQRAPARAVAECEAVTRLPQAPAVPVEALNPETLDKTVGYSHVVKVNTPQLIFSGTQVAFGFEESDARLAFERLSKVVEQAGASLKDTVFAGFYPLAAQQAPLIRKVRADFFAPERPPAATTLPFEGLPSIDAAFAMDVVVAK
jgi:enamine deaminase RidA (YjgF/YER057c/UK114 family)